MFSCLSDYFHSKKSFIKMFKNLEDISKNKLIVNVEEFGPEYNYIKQKNFTDYGYIMYLAGKYGKTVYCHGNTVHVKTEITPTDRTQNQRQEQPHQAAEIRQKRRTTQTARRRYRKKAIPCRNMRSRLRVAELRARSQGSWM